MTKPATVLHVDQLVRTNRRTVALVVTRDGKLIVRAPLRMAWKTIEQFIEQKRAWIEEKQAQARAYTHQAIPHSFKTGESFLYLGHVYPLVISQRVRPLLALELATTKALSAPTKPLSAPTKPVSTPTKSLPAPDKTLALPDNAVQESPNVQPGTFTAHPAPGVSAPALSFVLAAAAQPAAREVFVRWYHIQAMTVLRERIDYWSAQTGLVPCGLRITSARTRWGSCSARGVLSFPWRLVMAPLVVIDYVVVHELVHLQEKNHARAFWLGVARILPDYAHQVAWLKENGHLLMI